eukprot:scaffold318530_cov39-Prasinocladus_malaysianus.AAC.2
MNALHITPTVSRCLCKPVSMPFFFKLLDNDTPPHRHLLTDDEEIGSPTPSLTTQVACLRSRPRGTAGYTLTVRPR